MSYTISTRYEDLSLVQLHSLFSTKVWDFLTVEEKKDACQEVENRYAVENETQPCRIHLLPMEGSTYGYESNGCIYLNEHLVKDGQFITEDVNENGDIIYVPIKVEGANWSILDTVYHEGTHGIQEANDTLHRTYFDGSTDYNLYRIQGNEKEAFDCGQSNTLQAIASVQHYTEEEDVNAEYYFQTVRQEAFQSCLEKAIMDYNDPDIEQTLNQFIDDHDNGTKVSCPSESYQAVTAAYDAQYYSFNKASEMTDVFDRDEGIGLSDPESDYVLTDDGAFLDKATEYDEIEDDGASLGHTLTENYAMNYDNSGNSQDNGMEM